MNTARDAISTVNITPSPRAIASNAAESEIKPHIVYLYSFSKFMKAATFIHDHYVM